MYSKASPERKASTTPSMTWPSILFRRDTAGVELHVEGVSWPSKVKLVKEALRLRQCGGGAVFEQLGMVEIIEIPTICVVTWGMHYWVHHIRSHLNASSLEIQVERVTRGDDRSEDNTSKERTRQGFQNWANSNPLISIIGFPLTLPTVIHGE